MIETFKKIWLFAGTEQSNIKKSILLGVLCAIFNSFIFGALYVILNGLVYQIMDTKVALYGFLFMAVSIAGRMVISYFSQLQRVHAGYFMVANKRIYIGDKLREIPMGYFNENSLGNITGVATTILNDVEQTASTVLVTTFSGFINSVVFVLAITFFEWKVGLIVIAGMVLFIIATVWQERKFQKDAEKRQKAQANLVECVLETIQGMSVMKAFNLDLLKNKKVNQAIEESCMKNLAMEKAIMPFAVMLQAILKLFSVAIVIVSVLFYLNGQMTIVNCLVMLVAAFIIYEQLESAGHGLSTLRIAGTSIENANRIDSAPTMNQGAKDIIPEHTDIEFKNVSFAYEKRTVLKDINLVIPEKTTTAVIGPSGSGKTTLCNLIVRFWDVDKGRIYVGGHDVKNYTLNSLMKNVSMVFQNVYLFADTIENNIKFGNQGATHEEVVEAARKASCHEFIEKLPDGYNTVLDEGGTSLSGGEKQRISIARAILKDAPIIILDEATANVDPENEWKLQKAIEALTHNKTIIMIAHRLKTVKKADQIIVLSDGKIVQQGTHDKLINEEGIYANFVTGRKEAIGWKLNT